MKEVKFEYRVVKNTKYFTVPVSFPYSNKEYAKAIAQRMNLNSDNTYIVQKRKTITGGWNEICD